MAYTEQLVLPKILEKLEQKEKKKGKDDDEEDEKESDKGGCAKGPNHSPEGHPSTVASSEKRGRAGGEKQRRLSPSKTSRGFPGTPYERSASKGFLGAPHVRPASHNFVNSMKRLGRDFSFTPCSRFYAWLVNTRRNHCKVEHLSKTERRPDSNANNTRSDPNASCFRLNGSFFGLSSALLPSHLPDGLLYASCPRSNRRRARQRARESATLIAEGILASFNFWEAGMPKCIRDYEKFLGPYRVSPLQREAFQLLVSEILDCTRLARSLEGAGRGVEKLFNMIIELES